MGDNLADRLLESDFLRGDELVEPQAGRIGRYEILRLLGEGAAGQVFLARDDRIGRLVAVKLLQPGTTYDPQRFQREMTLLAAVRHPNVVEIYDAGLHAGRPYCVLEYVGGQTLAEARLPLDATVEVLRQVAMACQAAHAKGIVHRDLKPANILLEGCGGSREPVESGLGTDRDRPPRASPESLRAVVADFGLARLVDLSITQSGRLVGTPGYMSPEQVQAAQVDPRTDVYALGVMLYQALTGRLPFAGANLSDLLRSILEETPVPPHVLDNQVPAELERIAMKAMSREPNDRHASAAELADELAGWLGRSQGGTGPAGQHSLGMRGGSVLAGRNASAATQERGFLPALAAGVWRVRPWLALGVGVAATLAVVAAIAWTFGRGEHRAGVAHPPGSSPSADLDLVRHAIFDGSLRIQSWERELYKPPREISYHELEKHAAVLEPLARRTDLPAELRQQALHAMAKAYGWMGNTDRAMECLSSALNLGDGPLTGSCHLERAWLLWDQALQAALLDSPGEADRLREQVTAELRAALQDGLEDPWWRELAGILAALGADAPPARWQVSRAALDELRQTPEKPTELAARLTGDLLLLHDQPQEAIRCYEEALRLRPSYVQAYTGLALAHRGPRDAQRLGRSLEYALQAIDLNPRYEPSYALVVLLCRKATSLSARDLWQADFAEEALIARCAERLDRGRQALPDRVEILTACGGARLLQACVLRARRADAATANAAAIAVLESAVQQAPRAVPPRLLLGTAHLLRFHAARSPGDLQAAEDHLSEAARLAPDQADVHRWLGYLHRAAGRPQAAIAAWQRAVALNPRFTKELDPMIARARP